MSGLSVAPLADDACMAESTDKDPIHPCICGCMFGHIGRHYCRCGYHWLPERPLGDVLPPTPQRTQETT